MKKFALLVVVFAVAAFLAYKLLSDKGPKTVQIKDQALRIGKASDTFNTAFTSLLHDYYALKDALVHWDSLKADQAAYSLAAKADSLPLRQLQADSNIIFTAQSLTASIGGEAKGFTGETGLGEKRKAFNALTDEIYTLIHTINFTKETIYHMRSQIAFPDSAEGFWLSNTSQIVNPYLGDRHPQYKDKMLDNGQIVDSIAGK
jgi:Protein of unknown function (DUF3347)